MQLYKAEYRLCYAHRVWDPHHSYDDNCRMIHGHTADLSVTVKYDSNVNPHRHVESAIDEVFDFMNKKMFNRFFIDYSDPMFYTLAASLYDCLAEQCNIDMSKSQFSNPIILPGTLVEVAREINLTPFVKSKNSPIYDILRSYFITDFCPSSDNLTKWFYSLVLNQVNKIGANIEQVEWSSVPSRKIIYKP